MTDGETRNRERDDADDAGSRERDGHGHADAGAGPGDARSDEQPELAGRETDRNPVVHWLLVSGDRRRMVVGLSVAATIGFIVADLVGVIGITSASLIASAFTSAITGVFTIVAVTISINQLVLSRVLGSPARIRERAESVHEFRSRVEEMNPDVSVSSTMPAVFLKTLVGTLHERTKTLDSTYRPRHEDEQREDVDELARTLRTICEQVEDDLQDPDLSLYHVLAPILTNEFSQYLHRAREVKAATSNLTAAEERALDRVIEAIDEVTITRHYFKTLYIHEELATVSRLILLTGLPAVLVSMGVILFYSRDAMPVDDPTLLLVVSVGLGVVLLPLNVLFAYGLRIGTIAKMTTTFGTFTPVDEMP